MKTITKQLNIKDEIYPEYVGPSGTSLMAEIDWDYAGLKELFGQPNNGDGEKVQAEWIIMTPAGIATIYDYKQYDTPKTKVRDWHIGGKDEGSAGWVMAFLFHNELKK